MVCIETTLNLMLLSTNLSIFKFKISPIVGSCFIIFVNSNVINKLVSVVLFLNIVYIAVATQTDVFTRHYQSLKHATFKVCLHFTK